jgi:hypothetical protein
MTEKPCSERFSHALAAIAPTTTMSETGNFGANFLPSRMLATTKSERPSRFGLSDGRPSKTCQNCTNVRRDATATPTISHSIAAPT